MKLILFDTGMGTAKNFGLTTGRQQSRDVCGSIEPIQKQRETEAAPLLTRPLPTRPPWGAKYLFCTACPLRRDRFHRRTR